MKYTCRCGKVFNNNFELLKHTAGIPSDIEPTGVQMDYIISKMSRLCPVCKDKMLTTRQETREQRGNYDPSYYQQLIDGFNMLSDDYEAQ